MYKGKFGLTHLDHEGSLSFAYYIMFLQETSRICTAKGLNHQRLLFYYSPCSFNILQWVCA